MDRYLSAAWKISAPVVASPAITPTLETFRVRGDLSQHDHVAGLPVGTRGGILIRHYFPVDGEYVISPRLYRETVNIIRGLELEHDLEVTLDGERVVLARFGGREGRAGQLPAADAGRRRDGEALSEAPDRHGGTARRWRLVHQEELGDDGRAAAAVRARDASIRLRPSASPSSIDVTVEGPFNPAPSRRLAEPAADLLVHSRRAIAEATPCARTILSTLARRAYRGPVSETETTRLLGFYEKERARGGVFDQGIESALTFLLVQPAVPVSRRAGSRTPRRGASYRISDRRARVAAVVLPLEQHSRRRAAGPGDRGRLREPAVLEQQVRRMLKDERARALGQQLRRTVAVPAQPARPPARRRRLPGLRPQPARGAAARNRAALRERRPRGPAACSSCSTADYTFVNERLARHYGIPNIYGTQFRPRRGHRRGAPRPAGTGQHPRADVAEQPHVARDARQVRADEHSGHAAAGSRRPNVPPLDETPAKASSMRDRMEEHRAQPGVRRLPQADGPDRPRRSRTSTASAAGARWTTARPIDRVRAAGRRPESNGPCGLRQAIAAAGPTCSRAT